MTESSTLSTPAPAEPTTRRTGVLPRLGGAAFILAPLLLMGGAATSPLQTEPGEAGYIQSLAADPALSLVSANLFHYGWVALVFGALAAISLAPGRGRVWVRIAAVITAFGAVQMSGLLLSDWFLIGAGNTLPIDAAVAMDAAAKEGSAAVWQWTGQLAALFGLPALTLGLAKARVLPWWLAPFALLPFLVLGLNLGVLGALLGTALYAPVLVAGVRLLRGGADTAA